MQQCVRPNRIVVLTPLLDDDGGFLQTVEDFAVEKLVAQFAIEDLDKTVVGRPAGPTEVEGDSIFVSPQAKVAGDEFRPVVDTYRRPFSSSSCVSRRTADNISPPYFLRQR